MKTTIERGKWDTPNEVSASSATTASVTGRGRSSSRFVSARRDSRAMSRSPRRAPAGGASAASRLARLLDPFQARLMTRLAWGEAAVLRLESFDPCHARLAALLAGGASAASRLALLLDPFQARLMTRLACGEAAVPWRESFDPFPARHAPPPPRRSCPPSPAASASR